MTNQQIDHIDEIILYHLGTGSYGSVQLISCNISYRSRVRKYGLLAVKTLNNEKDYSVEKQINAAVSKSIFEKNLQFLIPMVHFNDDTKQIYFEALLGPTLLSYSISHYEKFQAFSVNFLTHIINNIIKGINELHGIGIIHYDIKTDNVVLDRNALPKIIDFSLSHKKGSRVQGIRRGRYQAPEMETSHNAEPSIDTYSLGVLIIDTLKKDDSELVNIDGSLKVEIVEKLLNEVILYNESERGLFDSIKRLVYSCVSINKNLRPSLSSALLTPMVKVYNLPRQLNINTEQIMSKELFLMKSEIKKIEKQNRHENDKHRKVMQAKDDELSQIKMKNTKLEESLSKAFEEQEAAKVLRHKYELLMAENKELLSELEAKQQIDKMNEQSMEVDEDKNDSPSRQDPLQCVETTMAQNDELPKAIMGHENTITWKRTQKNNLAIVYNECVLSKKASYFLKDGISIGEMYCCKNTKHQPKCKIVLHFSMGLYKVVSINSAKID